MAIVLSLLLTMSITIDAQEDDPFYLNLLKKGEQSFLSGNYKQAVKDLEIACFGIQDNKELRGKACVYLGLSYYYLKDKAQGNKYLNEAEKLLGPEGLNALDIDEEAKYDLQRLSQAFKSGRVVNPEGLRMLPQVPAERVIQSENLTKGQLERRIDQNPKNIPSYYELYSLYRIENNLKEAKKTIEQLIKNNPGEVFGYYMLGVILYQEREFKKATPNFEEFFRLSANLDLKQETRAEAIAFQILTLYYRGEKASAAQLIVASKEILPSESVLNLRMDNKDKIVLRSLLEEYNR